MAVGRLFGVAASLVPMLVLVGCSHRKPDACAVACGAGELCPEDSTCRGDGYCHAADDDSICRPGQDLPDAGPDADAEPGGDGDACDGAPDEIADSDSRDVAIPDGDLVGINRTMAFDTSCVTVESVELKVEIAHPYRGDVELELTAPSGDSELVLMSSDDSNPDIVATFDSTVGAGTSAQGEWVLNVSDVFETDVGMLEYWSLGINMPAP